MVFFYEEIVQNSRRLKELNFDVVSIYECEFNKFLKENPQIHAQINDSQLVKYSGMNVRDSLYGGRCEPFSVYYKISANEKIYVYDIVSMYPFVNKFATYCVGHPRIYSGLQCYDIAKFFDQEGVIKCRILPPRNVFIPTLPYRTNKKLFFPLCGKCAELTQFTPCKHSEMERSFWNMGFMRN